MMHLNELPNKKPDEHVVKFLRRQWFAWAGIIVTFVFMIGIPAGIALYFRSTVEMWLAHPVLAPIFTLCVSTYVLCLWLYAFLEFTDYYLDTWIVTTHRVISTEQLGLFKRVSSELHLAAVQDVSSKVTGIIHTFFDYGDVMVQTAAEKTMFVFHDVDHPEQIRELILKLVEEDKKRHAKNIVASIASGEKTLEQSA